MEFEKKNFCLKSSIEPLESIFNVFNEKIFFLIFFGFHKAVPLENMVIFKGKEKNLNRLIYQRPFVYCLRLNIKYDGLLQ